MSGVHPLQSLLHAINAGDSFAFGRAIRALEGRAMPSQDDLVRPARRSPTRAPATVTASTGPAGLIDVSPRPTSRPARSRTTPRSTHGLSHHPMGRKRGPIAAERPITMSQKPPRHSRTLKRCARAVFGNVGDEPDVMPIMTACARYR